VPALMTSPDYGMQVFLFWREEVADRDLQLVKQAGFRWVKQEFAWREIEGAGRGIFDWANPDRVMDQIDAYGLKVIARVGVQPEWAGGGYPEIGPPEDYQDFANFLTALATRYKGRIDAYQIWNEPNLAREWGNRPPNPAEYAQLLKLAYQSIKSVDPGAYIITAGLAPVLRLILTCWEPMGPVTKLRLKQTRPKWPTTRI
jgi:beta-glucosidase/6-phospho-beta-glucosidase/beta-galactosidase